MTKGVWVVLAITLVVVTGNVAMLWHVLQSGFSAREQPSELEVMFARQLRSLAMPKGQKQMVNPVPASEEVLAEARIHFADHCASCHGNDGRGSTLIGQNFYPRTPDLTKIETQSFSDGELFYMISNGIRFTGMPAWGKGRPEPDLDSWKLVHFIRYLPRITSEELGEMEKYNPLSQVAREEQERIDRFLQGEELSPQSPAGHH
ncbi:MAG: c-type cytochrome [Nitrospirota bacterium]|nr:c-type cytochrome [Nitrospirota bacterium]